MTRAVLLNRSGAVHRVVTNARGEEITSCGEPFGPSVPVSPKQALVFTLAACGACWREREHQWQHFVEGVTL